MNRSKIVTDAATPVSTQASAGSHQHTVGAHTFLNEITFQQETLCSSEILKLRNPRTFGYVASTFELLLAQVTQLKGKNEETIPNWPNDCLPVLHGSCSCFAWIAETGDYNADENWAAGFVPDVTATIANGGVAIMDEPSAADLTGNLVIGQLPNSGNGTLLMNSGAELFVDGNTRVGRSSFSTTLASAAFRLNATHH